jgi:serine/threonine-protein phosphatase CPPED1
MRSRPALLLSLCMLVLIPCLAQEQAYYFMMLTDTQFGMFAADKSFAQESANYEFAVAAVNRLKPGFVIILGDLVNKPADPAQIHEYLRISQKIDPSIPVYHVAGNHDVGNEPTPDSLAAYRKTFGRDYYGFRAGPVYGIVLNSTLIHSPKSALSEYEEQDAWLKKELAAAKASSAQHIVIFQHHPCFLKDAQEADQYENIPRERRLPMLELFHSFGVRNVFSGHTHKNVVAQDGALQVVANAPVGKPLGQDGSGIRIAAVTGAGVEHRYYDFGVLPDRLSLPRK